MTQKPPKDKRLFEIMLILIALGTVVLFATMGGQRMVVLNLFYLPIVLSGYFLGRSSAGLLALLCVLAVTVGAMVSPADLGAFHTPIMVGLALTLWGAVLGLTAILVGTLCDERAATVRDLHAAYVGVVEVLAKYLQGANPHEKARSVRVAELSQLVAEDLNFTFKQVDDVRVAALLHELGSVEITTQVIGRAVDTLGAQPSKHTFLGTDLVHSLGTVLEGALPLLANQDDAVRDCLVNEGPGKHSEMPMGASIIRAVRAYDDLLFGPAGEGADTPSQAVQTLREDVYGGFDGRVLDAIERAVGKSSHSTTPERVLA